MGCAISALSSSTADVVCPVHQNHDYPTIPRDKGVWYGQQNTGQFHQAGGGNPAYDRRRDRTGSLPRNSAESRLLDWPLQKGRLRRVNRAVRAFTRTRLWASAFDKTRSLRHALGLRQDALNHCVRQGRRGVLAGSMKPLITGGGTYNHERYIEQP